MLNDVSSQLVVAHFNFKALRLVKEVDLTSEVVSAIGIGLLQHKIILGGVFHGC